MRPTFGHVLRLAMALSSSACASTRARTSPPPALTIARSAGRHNYVFTSTQTSPGGRSRVQVAFTLITSADRVETAEVTAYRHASGDAPLTAGEIAPSCTPRLATSPGVIVVLPITPPPHRLADLIPDCVPEDLFGAASDILPLLMIQMQPAFRAAELRAVGDRLRFNGYETGWRLAPTLLDAKIVADSGVVALDSLTDSRAVIGWNTSPMRVDLVRQLSPNQRALLTGQEWFWARVVIDPRSGALLSAHTVVDSLALRMITPYSDSIVSDSHGGAGSRRPIPVTLVRSLDLREAMPDRRAP